MAIFRYDPIEINTWSNRVARYLDENVANCSTKFKEQMDKLAEPNVWTGAAAAQNYQDFTDTHKALIKFINAFGSSFQEAMNSVNKNVANLEVSNLGTSTNVGSSMNLSYSNISDITPSTIAQEAVVYDYITISEIGTSLNTIKQELSDVYESLKNEIARLNDGSGLWDGDAAGSAHEELTTTLTTNMDSVLESLDICIKNISQAAQNAQNADMA